MGLYKQIRSGQEQIAIIGMGYVGLSLALAFAKKIKVIGYEANQSRMEAYLGGTDPFGEVGDQAIQESQVSFTSDDSKLAEAMVHLIAVPSDQEPALHHVRTASRIVGRRLRKGAVVIYEATVYPGVTEEVCVPILEAESGLICGVDFKVGYSPERINPGDKVHRLENVIKIVSGMDEDTLEFVAELYELIVEAGVYRAESIKVAEAAKVIENAQRDVNIAFMNELSMLFHEMEIDTKAVLQAAGTKWNFMRFTPGLVGGHAVGIDPYNLMSRAEDNGYRSQIMLAGRHINEGMGKYVAQQLIKLLLKLRQDLGRVKVGLLGLSYKEDCSDIGNTKVMDIIKELDEYGISCQVADPIANARQALEEYGIQLTDLAEMKDLNVVIVAVPHSRFSLMRLPDFDALYGEGVPKILFDIKASYSRSKFEQNGYLYWSL
ncbi:nucleotide sugar dehydrogenase [Paenibacillus filicis]|uniref:Nucleotide sugar dehydrogenase n=1 Tax=Paenibacillus filicis TaxID=669464 RepID=A0ABU9DUT0_9BACL